MGGGGERMSNTLRPARAQLVRSSSLRAWEETFAYPKMTAITVGSVVFFFGCKSPWMSRIAFISCFSFIFDHAVARVP